MCLKADDSRLSEVRTYLSAKDVKQVEAGCLEEKLVNMLVS